MTKISRSEYQRVVEENKKLLADIRILVGKGSALDKMTTEAYYKKLFGDKDNFYDQMEQIIILGSYKI